ncbi:hypothetical protein BASA62_000634 [Batrachochytrium salamandrivorans]|nr:hypothetical protein BASA62_000634 [Batrachochytrium salamandrivorans]
MSSRTPNRSCTSYVETQGGDVEFANSMVQLFKPDFQPFGHRYLMNKITYNIFVDGEDPNVDPYAKAWKETKQAVASPMFFSLTRWSLQTPLARPISALWESSMMQGATLPVKYSLVASRDTVLEPSLEKTNRLVVVVLLSWKLDPFSSVLPLTDFKKFPFSQELTSGSTTYANTLSVGVTQLFALVAIMVKPLRMRVSARYCFRPRWSDLQPNPTTNTQYDRIAAKPCSYWSEEWLMERLLSLKQKSGPPPKTKFSIPVSAAGSALGNNRITIVGKTAGKQVLKTNP